MPYSSVSEALNRFPKLKKYPREAQQMFLKVVNTALKQYPDDEGKAIATAWAAVNKKYGKRDQALIFDEFTVSFDMAAFKEFNGKIEIPTIFTREGVQNGGFKPWSELSRTQAVASLEGKPVVYGHPPENRPVNSFMDMIVGEIDNVVPRESDHTLHGITRIYTDKAPSSWLEQLRKGLSREGSVGYWSYSDAVSGTFKGDIYDRVERDIIFDHYAVGIPKGACPVSAGCGLGFNESHSDTEMESFDLNKLEGTGTVCLDKLREFLVDVKQRVFGVNYSKAAEDREWSFDASKYSLAQLKKACAVVTGDGDKKSDCRLPHHLPGDGKTHGGTLVWRGVSAAGAALMGSRGGLKNISAADKARAKRHLTPHYHEFDKEAPWEQSKGDVKMQLNEEERTAFEKKIEKIETEKAGLKEAKEQLEAKVKEYEEADKKTKDEQRKSLITEITKVTEEKPETYKEWDLTHLKHMKEKLEQGSRDKLIEEITKETGEEAETYKYWNVPQLEHLKKKVVSEEGETKKGTDKSAITPPTEKSGEAWKPSMAVAGKELTVGNLMKPPKAQGE